MQIVEATRDARVLDPSGRPAYSLHAGRRYALYDHEAALGVDAGSLCLLGSLDRTLPPYQGQSVANARMLLPFIGRSGDALVTAVCLADWALRRPHLAIDVACRPAPKEVFQLVPPFGAMLDYPPSAHRLDDYDYHLSFEDIDSLQNGQRRSLLAAFSACLCIDPPTAFASLQLAEDLRLRWQLPPSNTPRVGIHVGRASSLRTYPSSEWITLANMLAGEDLEVFLLGHDEWMQSAPELRAPGIRDLRGCTASAGDLAALTRQMDVFVACDSFPLHLAAILGVPTVALFAPTSSRIVSDYPAVAAALSSRAACSPCHQAGNACPLGHARCIAQFDPGLDPAVVAAAVHGALRPRVPLQRSGATAMPADRTEALDGNPSCCGGGLEEAGKHQQKYGNQDAVERTDPNEIRNWHP